MINSHVLAMVRILKSKDVLTTQFLNEMQFRQVGQNYQHKADDGFILIDRQVTLGQI